MAKHLFVVDENVIYHAVNLVDRKDKFDKSSMLFFANLAKNCHKVFIDSEIDEKYESILSSIKSNNKGMFAPNAEFLNRQIVHNSLKTDFDFDKRVDVDDISAFPKEDLFIIEAALKSNAKVVTNDEGLYNAIKGRPDLNIEVYTAKEAIELVKIP